MFLFLFLTETKRNDSFFFFFDVVWVCTPAGGELLLSDGGLLRVLPRPGEGVPLHRLRPAGVQRARARAAGELPSEARAGTSRVRVRVRVT